MTTTPVPEVNGTAPEAAGGRPSWSRRQHGAVGAGEVRRPGRRAARAGTPRDPQGSPLTSRRSPGTRSAHAPRLNNATSRPTPRSHTRSCSPGAARVAASGSSAWTYGGSWSRSPPPAYRSAPPGPSSLAFEAAANLAGPHFPWLEKGSLVGTIAPASELRSSEGVHERTQLRAWLGS